MVQKIRVLLISDLDGTEADEMVRFALDGQPYEIDLTTGQAEGMRAELAVYVEHARRVSRPKAGQYRAKKNTGRTDLPDIRQFARDRGYDIKDRGQIPVRIVEEYDTLQRSAGTAG